MAKGMFVDTSICTGCKACQVACKEWNGLAAEPSHFRPDQASGRPVAVNFTGDSYDNTGRLSATDWRHVRFIEQFSVDRRQARWLFASDSCKHCTDAGCLNACPTGSLIRTDLGNVFVQQDVCIGCKYCVPACPFGVISFSAGTGTVHKCTLCNDRIHNGLGTACAKACPTGSIRFGEVSSLRAAAQARLAEVTRQGQSAANLYGLTEAGGLNVFYLLLDEPPVYGLPVDPVVPQRRLAASSLVTVGGALALGVAALISFRERKHSPAEAAEVKMALEAQSPEWLWYFIPMYFFVGGVSAGAYFIGSLLELFGGERQRLISRTAYYVAFPLILLAPMLLIGDLGQPFRFWHLFFYPPNGLPYLNLQSPLSVGSWALLVYGAMSALSFLDNLVADGRLRFAPFAAVYNRIPRGIYAAVGSVAGFFVAGYTGVLLNVTARPLWAATDPLVGALFIASAGSTGAAAVYLALAARRLLPESGGSRPAPAAGAGRILVSPERFQHFDLLAKLLELALALAMVILAGGFAAPLLRGPYALMFWGGAMLLGTLVPLVIHWYAGRPGRTAPLPPALAISLAVLVLVGGALLRIAVVQAGQV